MKSKVGFVSLGCPKALVDSERIITRLRAEDYELVASHETADLVIVNTCGFINEAVEESLASIGEALEKNGKVIVTGCLGARADVIRNRFPNVLKITGPAAYEDVIDAVHEQLPPAHDPFTSLVPPQGIKLTPRHYAYLKIAEGCNHKCTFCIIPSMRGKLVSRPLAEVVSEAEKLAKAGVKELLVISQDTSAYGIDLRKLQFYDLAKALGELGVWVRLHYVYPYPHVDDVIPLMAEGKLLPYLDVPFQHGSPRILKLMKRPASSENNLERIKKWRTICPDLTIRSTFIVGFPGETADDFKQLLDFINEAQLDRVGCFQYSPVEGAVANNLPNPIPDNIKQERYNQFMALQEKISRAKLQKKLNQTIQVIIDEVNSNQAIGRSHADAPEIDGVVKIKNAQHLKPGEMVSVKIKSTDAYDLVGKII